MHAGYYLISHLRFLDVHAFPTIAPPTGQDGTPRKSGPHHFDLVPNTQYVTIRSNPIDVPVLDFGGFGNLLRSTQGRDAFETSEHEERLREFFEWGGRVSVFMPE